MCLFMTLKRLLSITQYGVELYIYCQWLVVVHISLLSVTLLIIFRLLFKKLGLKSGKLCQHENWKKAFTFSWQCRM